MGTNITGIGNANAIGFKSRVTGGIYFPPELKDALVGVWSAYGKSNDSTDRNIIKNKIKDRGGDFVISNAAFKLNSGFGGFVEDFTSWDRIDSSTAEISNDGSKIKCINTTLNVQYLFNYINRDISSFKVKISNFTKGDITYYYRKEDGIEAFFKITPLSVVNSDKVIELPKSYNTVENGTGSRGGFYSSNINIGVTIEQIPSFEGAFVTDGVNDLITSTKTVQEMLGGSNEFTVVSMIHGIGSKNAYTNVLRESGSNYIKNTSTADGKTGIYGYTSKDTTKSIITDILGDKNDYKLEHIQTSTPSTINSVFSVAGWRDSSFSMVTYPIAWYWTIIANKVLTTDQINQVIAYYNLDRCVEPTVLYDVKRQGLSNDTPDSDWYLKDYSGNGYDMTLYNYAKTPESGINEDGGLQSDGVEDYGKVTGLPIYKDYTVVADYERFNIGNIEGIGTPPVLSKSYTAGQGSFIMNFIASTGNSIRSYSFGADNTRNFSDLARQIFYQSKYKSQGFDITAGTGIDGDSLWLGTARDNDSRFFNGAIYSLMSFPYSMSEFLIERQLKKHKLGTLYPDMVEFRPIVKSNSEYQVVDCYIDTFPAVVGNYYPINSKLRIAVTTKGKADEVISLTVNGVSLGTPSVNGNRFTFNGTLSDKSPQKINITIDEYIRYEDIVQPYPVIFQITDRNTNQRYNWGDKIKVGSSIRLSQGEKPNLLSGLYSIKSYEYEGKTYSYNQLTNLNIILTKQSISLSCNKTWLLDDNEPKCILSPRLLRIPNSSYKILGYIPDISGHGNHGKINNSAYAEGSGVNEDGSYQLDGVDDFVTIPTIAGKQVLIKLNWQNKAIGNLIYDQRGNGSTSSFAILPIHISDTTTSRIAYQARNANGITYIDGIRNEYIKSYSLENIIHNITITNPDVSNKTVVLGASNRTTADYFAKYALYDFMLFDDISTDDKILELNEYVGIEAKVELPPYYWDTYGKTNSDADRDTIQQRGVAVGDYDLTNTNFAYDKMSGYGGYSFKSFNDSQDWNIRGDGTGVEIVSRDGYSITIKKLIQNSDWQISNNEYRYPTILDKELPFKCISNKRVGLIWQLKYKTEGATSDTAVTLINQQLTPNVPLEINLPYKTQDELTELGAVSTSVYYLLYFSNTILEIGEEYTVEMLPLYPNGIVYDGVDDYSKNANIPALDDFTAIMKRKWLKNQGCPLIKGSKVYEGGNGNALLFEWDKAYNFVFYKRTDIMEGKVPENISFITPTNYNGNVITRGSGQDTNGICIAGDGNAGFANMVFYKLILYPKTIPLLQINFLKNLMERDEIIDLNNPIFIKNE